MTASNPTTPAQKAIGDFALQELVEMITHLAFYVGWPSAMSAVTGAKKLFEQKAV